MFNFIIKLFDKMFKATRAAGQCQCYPGSTCPSGTGGIDIRIVNQVN